MKKERIFKYEYNNPISNKFKDCPCNEFYYDDKNVYMKNDLLFVSVENHHSSISCYVAKIEEKDGKTYLSGKIIVNPDSFGNPRYKKGSDFVVYLLMFPIVLPIIIIAEFAMFFYWIISKIKKVPKEKELTIEEKLDNIMINKLGCIKIENNN